MGLKRSLADSARSLYRFGFVRSALLLAGPARWKLPPVLRWRIESEAAVRRRHRRSAVEYGYPERVVPTEVPSPSPTFGHRIVARPYRVSAPFVAQLERVWLVGPNATPVTTEGRVLLSPYRNEPRMLTLEAHPELEQFVRTRAYERPWPADSIHEPLHSMVGRLDVNYAHWLLESCAQLEGVEAWADRSGRRPRLLVRSEGPAFHRSSLARLGYSDGALDWPVSPPPLAVDALVVASLPGTPVACSPRSIAWLRSRLLGGENQPAEARRPSVEATRLYIARPPGGWRYVENGVEVEGALEGRGFTVVAPERFAFDEQVELFRRAQVVVAQHGAGLTNMLFAPDDGVLVELTGGYGDGLFCSLANAVGQRYRALAGEGDGDGMFVDLGALMDVLDEVIGRAP